jgi:Protein of unknown function (DUF3987)
MITRTPQASWKPVVIDQDGDDSDITQLDSSSPGTSDCPAPLGRAAYQGLAGKFVDRVLPESEADPVALLIQFLVAFANLVGRRPHAIAGGAPHPLNLYAASVGQTSKSRKGTSWAHVARLLGFLDEEWSKDHIIRSVSSGEGLIWRVRDPIFKTVKGENQVSDDGIVDKRLCLVATELGEILTVMSREGNTLSAVLRNAWDDGNLTTVTKNSPARATDAFISIIGHVTRDELRKLLGQTESANGFGNRFLWVLVNRSKCLPEGGDLPPLGDIVIELRKAIEFARNTDKLVRTASARELWQEVYPALSEGKVGLVGALTARAEAQVLRLSCIYALLNRSPVVDVAHLRAALELWRYCEESTCIIFESGTGNKQADRILQALKVAHQTGLTKTEISYNVFTRNVTRFELDEALRLIDRLKLGYRTTEKSTGRAVERWFHGTSNKNVA